MNVIPKFDIEKIKYGTDKATFDRAIKLYESEKITKFNELYASFCAVVVGTKPYDVSIEARDYKMGECTCYLGQNNTLCKHIVAVFCLPCYVPKVYANLMVVMFQFNVHKFHFCCLRATIFGAHAKRNV